MKYKPSPNFPTGTSLNGYVTASFSELETILGPFYEDAPDQNKVSTEWVLESEDGEIVTVYDYKETNLYWEQGPSVAEFRARPEYSWHVGAKSKESALAFIAWLESELRKLRSSEV